MSAIKVFDHTPEWKAKRKAMNQAWREYHVGLASKPLHDICMRIKNGPNTDAQIAQATGLSTATIAKLRKFEHKGMPFYSTMIALERFFNLRK